MGGRAGGGASRHWEQGPGSGSGAWRTGLAGSPMTGLPSSPAPTVTSHLPGAPCSPRTHVHWRQVGRCVRRSGSGMCQWSCRQVGDAPGGGGAEGRDQGRDQDTCSHMQRPPSRLGGWPERHAGQGMWLGAAGSCRGHPGGGQCAGVWRPGWRGCPCLSRHACTQAHCSSFAHAERL